MSLKLNLEFIKNFVKNDEISAMWQFVKIAHERLYDKTDFSAKSTGWLDLPDKTFSDDLEKICKIAQEIRNNSEIFVVIGTGGSYLGARACIEFLRSSNYNFLNNPKIFFAGNNLSADSLGEILEICRGKEVSVDVVSKSGGTLEPMTVFEVFENFLKEKYHEVSNKHIFCTTGAKTGNLLRISKKKGYKIFDIPENIGGRFSCLTSVGLLPIAVAGADIHKIILGARCAQKDFENTIFNDCYRYALIRNILYKKGKIIEIMAGYEPRLESFFSWWKQLFGESEGKNHMGIFPASSIFTMDLHSLGQFIQDGSRNIFETVLSVKNSMPPRESNKTFYDKFSKLNKAAEKATLEAHVSGGVPNILIEIDDFSEFTLGYLIYFFEKACAISAYLLGVDPFDQPGVELYKKNIKKYLV